MGTGFDRFDWKSRNPALLDPAEAETQEEAQKSAPTAQSPAPPPEIGRVQRDRRMQLNDVMNKHGFKGIRAEWWHYQYTGFERPLKPQDFVIPSAKTQ